MIKIFEHTSSEKGMWRGWFRDGQNIEVNWIRRGWAFGVTLTIHDDDDDRGRRLLNLAFWRFSIWLPLGFTSHPWAAMEGPQWLANISSEFGLRLCWGHRSRSWDLPWSTQTLRYEKQMQDGSWVDVFDRDAQPATEAHPYTYTLRSGVVQRRLATISKRRHVLTYAATKWLKWPSWIKESIDVRFDGEVGGHSGSWKGGCIGCGYDLRLGETMLECLRRMEKERKF